MYLKNSPNLIRHPTKRQFQTRPATKPLRQSPGNDFPLISIRNLFLHTAIGYERRRRRIIYVHRVHRGQEHAGSVHYLSIIPLLITIGWIIPIPTDLYLAPKIWKKTEYGRANYTVR